MTLFDDSVITWLLTCVCAPQCIKNPYVTAKLVEVLFVISPSVQQNTGLQITVSTKKFKQMKLEFHQNFSFFLLSRSLLFLR